MWTECGNKETLKKPITSAVYIFKLRNPFARYFSPFPHDTFALTACSLSCPLKKNNFQFN